MIMSWATLAIFVISYVLFAVFPGRRTRVAVPAAAILVITGVLSPAAAFRAVNWNVMGIFVGMLIVADFFMDSRVPAFLAERIVDRAGNTGQAILFICGLTAFISAFVENVATVLIVAPIAMSLARKLDFNPTRMMIAIAVSSNLQGTATLIGDPPSMLLGGFAHMTFNDFFFYRQRPSIFFAVELGALASFLVLIFFFRRHRDKPALAPAEKVRSWIPTIILTALIAALAASSFLDPGFSSMAGVLCLAAGLIALAWGKWAAQKPFRQSLKSLDWDTTFFLVGVFVLVGSLTAAGWIDAIATSLSGIIGGRIFLGYTLIVLLSVVFSAFVDNVPYLAAMLPVALSLAHKLGMHPSLFLFGLLIGASLGGNITPLGASANIVACGLLKKEGHEVRFMEFVKIGLPFTLAAVGAAYVFVWFVWR